MKFRKKRNKIWSFTKEFLEEAVKNSKSLNQVLIYLKCDNRSSSYKILKNKLYHENIDFSHIKLGLNTNKGKTFLKKKKPLSEILIENSTYLRVHLKSRLLNEGLLENKCYECGLLPEWNNKKLSLQIDHINGVADDNRLFNLRMLCPNCHSQTSNFGGRNIKNKY